MSRTCQNPILQGKQNLLNLKGRNNLYFDKSDGGGGGGG